jgi:FAD/FMN-containing dehydrogenase
MWERLAPWAAGDRIYLNFPGHGEDADTLVRRSYGPNYGRLLAVKRAYDPDNVFRFNQNIDPEVGPRPVS